MFFPKLEAISVEIAAGRASKALHMTREVLHDRKSRRFLKPDEICKLASFLRRLDRPQEAHQLLFPLIHGRGRKFAKPSSAAAIEFAEILLNLHLIQEARSILCRPEVASHARAKVRLGYSYLYTNDFAEAAKILFSILLEPSIELSEYEVAVIRVNWLLARSQMIAPGSDPKLLSEIASELKIAQSQKHALLEAALIAIGLRVSFIVGRESAEWLNRARQLPESGFSAAMGHLFEILIESKEGRITSAQTTQSLKQLEKSANHRRHFGVVDEIYKRWKFDVPSLVIHVPELPPKLSRFLQILDSQPHVPFSPGALWDRMMAPAYYCGKSSRDCIHQYVLRLRSQLKVKDVPLDIVWDRTGYRLTSQKSKGPIQLEFGCAWKSYPTTRHDHRYIDWLDQVRRAQQELKLSALEKTMSEFPRRTHQFFLNKAVREGLLLKIAKGRATYYVPAQIV